MAPESLLSQARWVPITTAASAKKGHDGQMSSGKDRQAWKAHLGRRRDVPHLSSRYWDTRTNHPTLQLPIDYLPTGGQTDARRS